MLPMITLLLGNLLQLCLVIIPVTLVCFRIFASYNRASNNNGKNIAFLHPYCFGSGGGERVLWEAISHILPNRNRLGINNIIIYTATIDNKPVKLQTVLNKVTSRFEIQINPNHLQYLKLVPLYHHKWIEPKYHKFAAIFTQSLITVILAFEGLYRYVPNIFIDTTGFAFTYPIARLLFNCKVLSYTHYPTISNDMLDRVSKKLTMYNNAGWISKSPLLTKFKLYYYRIFAVIYGLNGYFSDITMVNSRWTYNHIKSIWWLNNPSTLHIVYPPCNTDYFTKIFTENTLETPRKKQIISVGQFRPEKDHKLQINSFAKFLKMSNEHNDTRLILVGGVRNDEDKGRVEELKELVKELNIEDNIVFEENLEFSKLIEYFKESFVGLHTMIQEHFGICVVEFMMAYLVVLAHCSGGPESDIISDENVEDVTEIRTDRGILATKEDEYAKWMKQIFDGFENGLGWMDMRKNAREYAVDHFNSDKFKREFETCLVNVCR